MTSSLRPSLSVLILALAWAFPAAGLVRADDAHTLFETDCATCHGPHAGAFTRDSIIVAEDGLRGRQNGALLATFLRKHAGGRTAEDVFKLLDMFRHQVAAGGVYAKRCRICHERARDLARHELKVVEGRLVGRYTQRDIAHFLARHGRLQPDERAPLLALLLWQVESATR